MCNYKMSNFIFDLIKSNLIILFKIHKLNTQFYKNLQTVRVFVVNDEFLKNVKEEQR